MSTALSSHLTPTNPVRVPAGGKPVVASAAIAIALLVMTYTALTSWIGTIGWRGFVLGQDFRALYTGGLMTLHGVRSEFYTVAGQLHWQQSFSPELTEPTRMMPFASPPFASLPLMLVAWLPFESAYLAWIGINAALLVIVGRQLVGLFQPHGRASVICATLLLPAFLPVIMTFVQGQFSFILLGIVLLTWTSLHSGHPLRAGLILSLLVIKPYLIAVPALAFVLWRQWRVVAGLALGLTLLGLVSLALVGFEGILNYVEMLRSAMSWGETFTVHPRQMHTLRGAIQSLLGSDDETQGFLPWSVLALLTLGFGAWAMRRPAPLSSTRMDGYFALSLLLALLLSPHGNMHDLSLLILVGALLSRLAWAYGGSLQRTYPFILILGYAAPWAAFLTGPILGILPTILVMSGASLLLGLWLHQHREHVA